MKTLMTITGGIVLISLIFVGYAFLFKTENPDGLPPGFQVKKILPRNQSNLYFTFQHIRHATVLLSISGKRILVDPMLAAYHTLPPIPLTRNRVSNPQSPLPVDVETLTSGVDAIIVTHNHNDHFDKKARQILPKDIVLFCQPADAKKFEADGFTRVRPIRTDYRWEGILISRTPGKHGTGLVEKIMGKVSGFVLQTGTAPSVYITGDTVFNEDVRHTVDRFKPDWIIANAGSAQMVTGSNITMNALEIEALAEYADRAVIVPVHMEAINHCSLTRDGLKTSLEGKGCSNRIQISSDGEKIDLL